MKDTHTQHRTVKARTIVIGSGAAGFNAADTLYSLGSTDVIIVSENVNWGTSRNTGSDKQTYYKLTLSGSAGDSTAAMAEDLYKGTCVDGCHAMCEAAGSAEGFFKLVHLGVPFPKNEYGEYVGYKTDHDPHERATSAGPYTSRYMTEALEKSVREKHIPIYSGYQLIKIVTDNNKVHGFIALNLENCAQAKEPFFTVFECENLILATGGPSLMYRDSVYPASQHGATGEAFEAGARGKNLTEWQIGLASIQPRWNVSGTYMQVLPRFISTDQDGSDEKEFLFTYPVPRETMMSYVFLKGYQWPFDVRKLKDGSSLIDALVYCEKKKGRRVFLDYRTNPLAGEIDFTSLSSEAYEYLRKAGACFGTPYERLAHMNMPAVSFYREHGIDLAHQMLEIALCVQHNNGGIAVDENWQTSVQGMFAVGEAAATHGVYRPGGSALNAGQTGSRRAAEYIAFQTPKTAHRQPQSAPTAELSNNQPQSAPTDKSEPARLFQEALDCCRQTAQQALESAQTGVLQLIEEITSTMTSDAAAVRSEEKLKKAFERCSYIEEKFTKTVSASSSSQLPHVFRLRSILISQKMYLAAMLNYAQTAKKSRGSALYTDSTGQRPYQFLSSEFTYTLQDGSEPNIIQEIILDKNGNISIFWRQAQNLTASREPFETVWRKFREKRS